jgi:hypothetical protein
MESKSEMGLATNMLPVLGYVADGDINSYRLAANETGSNASQRFPDQ